MSGPPHHPGMGRHGSVPVQLQVRRNAMEMADAVQEISGWEKTMKARDAKLRASRAGGGGSGGAAPPVRGRGGAAGGSGKRSKLPPVRGFVPSDATGAGGDADHASAAGSGARAAAPATTSTNAASTTTAKAAAKGKSGSAADHTYDKGYKKWENFDEDAELVEVESGTRGVKAGATTPPAVPPGSAASLGPHAHAHAQAATAAGEEAARKVRPARRVHRTRAGVNASHQDREQVEREDGNRQFRAGNFAEAVKCYTRCVALNPRNALAYSNRAMAFLRLKEFVKAEDDATSALAIDPEHVKSLQRRAAARNGMGRHREALADLRAASALEPSKKQILVDLRKTVDMHKSAVRKAPRTRVGIVDAAGPSMPVPPAKTKGKGRSAGSSGDAEAGSSGSGATTAATASTADGAGTGAGAALADGSDSSVGDGRGDGSADGVMPGGAAPSTPPTPPVAADDRGARAGAGASAGDAGASSGGASESKAAPPRNPGETAARNQEAAAKAATKAASKGLVGTKAPRTLYEFERAWRSLRADPFAQGELLQRIPAKDYKKIFKASVDADLLVDIVATLDSFVAPAHPGVATSIAKAIGSVPRFSLALAFLSNEHTTALREFFDGLQESADDDGNAKLGATVAATRKLYGV